MTEYDTAHDQPLGGLAAADPVLLRNPQIEAALVEVRFAASGQEVGSDVAFLVRDAAEQSGFTFPQMRPTQTQEFTIRVENGVAQPDVQQQATGWQMATEDGLLAVTLLHGTLVVQATRYERWRTTLEPVLDHVVSAVAEAFKPAMLNRVGVRFINRLTRADATTPATWTDATDPAFLGPLVHSALGPNVVGTQQQSELRLGPAQGALIRHGVFADAAAQGAFSYLLDLDIFDQTAQPFEPLQIVATARRLDRTALSLFQQIVLPDYRATMNPYARVDAEGTVVESDDFGIVANAEGGTP